MAAIRPMGCTSVQRHPATPFYPAFHTVEFVFGSADMLAMVPDNEAEPVEVDPVHGASRIRSVALVAPMLRQWIAEFTEKGLATTV